MPNGLCFSPDEKKLYVSDTGILGGPTPKHTWIRVFDVDDDGKLSNDRMFHDFKDTGTGIADTCGSMSTAICGAREAGRPTRT